MDNTALAERTDSLPATVEPVGNPLAAILSDPKQLQEIPVDTVERLFAIDRELRADHARQAFAAAMNRLQGRMTPVHKAARNPQTGSMYAKAESVEKMLNPLLSDEGFSVSCSTVEPVITDCLRYCMTVRHLAGHEERHYLDAPIDDKGIKGSPTKTKLHGMGSTMTYCRRYLLTQVFGVQLSEDADGNPPPDAETVSEKQVADLEALIEEVGADRAQFLKICKVDKISELPASKYRGAVTRLEAKRT